MPAFGWMRLAYSLLVLATLAAIMQLGSPSAATQPDPPEPPKKTTAAVWSSDEPEEKPAKAEPANRPDRPAKTPDNGPAGARRAPAAEPPGPPVFHRPSPAVPGLVPGGATGGAWEPGGRPVCGDLARFPSTSEVLFPLPKARFGSYEDTWGAPRPQGGHEGTDLMVPAGTPEYAITDGTIVPVAGSNRNGWNPLGGYAVMLEASYSVGPVRKGDLFYYAHLQRASDLEIGATVRAGQVLGYAGDTGQGPEVTKGLFPPHLHFGWYDTSGARSALDSGAMNPFPLLEWIEANGGALRGGSDVRYCAAPQPQVPKPSGDRDRWPAPKNPGTRPDLHAASPEPSPAAAEHARSHKHEPHRAAGPAPGKPGARPHQEQGEERAEEKRIPLAKPAPAAPRPEKMPPPERPGSSAGETPERKNEPQPPPDRDGAGKAGDPAPPDEKGETSGDRGEPKSGQPDKKRPRQDDDGEKRGEKGSHPAPDPADDHEDNAGKNKDKKGEGEKQPPEGEEEEPDEDAETTAPEGVDEETVPEETTGATEPAG